ncbi:haloacid dehalogenase superfamily, subfamily IA, variant 1 with third motif having Dx(3-4)D or Dx(3-4)E [Microbispora rosea]|uniref:Haloacid dehalogenase superfamily, subfamily IA, variant 1 with third motif having Dx(3-4)D or Dx(3-4)E n=1 Tax=Microbispora rosea TaxID=58117 RepID=A0A1N6YWL5_9ACTN|nr:HAD-IA family hydrolase [Microbispora rosea]GIH46924.1 haloacid dehalogenase [Microbispora rosea subsp. rosea]SIR18841.1 haloacid dehalogenase superfamily, subfamily IA, variant 1 with third motif having Dx(3-4)D or Dx(3-4)E [Microbispora rosea]
MVRALVFDVGETLIDETRIWSRWADRLGVPRLTFMGVLGGMAALDRSHREAFELIRPGIDLDAEIDAWRREDPDGLRENFDADDLYPDVRPGLAALREAGYDLVVAGNQPPQAYDALVAMDLPVDGIHTSAGWGLEKPDPAFFAKVAAVCGHEPGQILYVGDRLDNDVLPAVRAGMRTALLRRGPWGYLHAARPEAAEADIVADGLTDLVRLAPTLG